MSLRRARLRLLILCSWCENGVARSAKKEEPNLSKEEPNLPGILFAENLLWRFQQLIRGTQEPLFELFADQIQLLQSHTMIAANRSEVLARWNRAYTAASVWEYRLHAGTAKVDTAKLKASFDYSCNTTWSLAIRPGCFSNCSASTDMHLGIRFSQDLNKITAMRSHFLTGHDEFMACQNEIARALLQQDWETRKHQQALGGSGDAPSPAAAATDSQTAAASPPATSPPAAATALSAADACESSESRTLAQRKLEEAADEIDELLALLDSHALHLDGSPPTPPNPPAGGQPVGPRPVEIEMAVHSHSPAERPNRP